MDRQENVQHCFGCGKENPIGLHLSIRIEATGAVTLFTPTQAHAGYGDRMHGGLVTTLLDEVMGDYVYRTVGKPAYTARLEVRFHSSVPIGETVRITVVQEKIHGRLVVMSGRVCRADGTLAAEGKATLMIRA